MSTFVLVHGGRHGGWCWRRVAPLLRAEGHEVHAPTLTGLGERHHLATPDVGLSTHVQDVTAILEYEDLDSVVLVGHSYGGMIITAVADAATERVERLVYLDGLVPRCGEAVIDLLDPAFAATLRDWVREEGDGWRLPAAATRPQDYGVTRPDDVVWVAARLTAQPFRTYEEAIELTGRGNSIPRTFIACTGEGPPLLPPLCRQRAEDAGWPVSELASGHDAMITDPSALARLLLAPAPLPVPR